MATILTDEILSLLREGRAVAARVPAERAGWSGWVWVRPVMRGRRTLAQARDGWTRERLASPYDGTIEHFEVRRVELSDWHLDDARFFDMDYAIRERPITDLRQLVNSEAGLEAWLKANGVAPGSLADPPAVEYPDPPVARSSGGGG